MFWLLSLLLDLYQYVFLDRRIRATYKNCDGNIFRNWQQFHPVAKVKWIIVYRLYILLVVIRNSDLSIQILERIEIFRQ